MINRSAQAMEQRDKVEAAEAGRRQRTGMAMPIRGETPVHDISQPTTAGGNGDEQGSGEIPLVPAETADGFASKPDASPAPDATVTDAAATEAEWKEPAVAVVGEEGDEAAVKAITKGVATIL